MALFLLWICDTYFIGIAFDSGGVAAGGGTILFGRGTGIHEEKSILGLMIEPEKEIVLTIAESSIADNIAYSIIKTVNLNEPGTGVGFIVSLEKLFGISHMHCDFKSLLREDSEP